MRNDKTARLWDFDTGEPYGDPFRHQGAVGEAYFVGDDRFVLTYSEDQTARFWDVETGEPIGNIIRHQAPIDGVVLNGDETLMITYSSDKTIRLWDISDLEDGEIEKVC